ncbi:MAG: class I SAM-dependent methyltransferase [Proteobacteria bacterium]|nr:class I SAM-dependent methyltransferase [Pseudomonadota bacterium]
MRLWTNLILEVGKLKARLNKAAGVEIFDDFPPDLGRFTIELIKRTSRYTMTSRERISSLEDAVRYIVDGGIPGAIVECGVWRGGSMMAAALTLRDIGETDRELFLFDTFEGMPTPGDEDVSVTGKPARPTWNTRLVNGESQWCRCELDVVQANLRATGYDQDRIHFVKGMVEDTLPCDAIEGIALLRLDTDWYDSTKWELEQLFPLLAPGGVLIIDDYGRWQGCRKAVDEYFAENGVNMLLTRVDSCARVGVKP